MTTISSKEFIEKYGDVKVKFSSYFKFSFTYAGELPDGKKITVSVGGNSDDIYRMGVVADEITTISALYPYSGCVWYNKNIVESFYDYD